MINRFGQILFSFILTNLLFLISISPVFACMPGPPDPWFSSEMAIDTSTLPPGVQIIPIQTDNATYGLINTNSEPFYLVQEHHTSWMNFPNSEIPSKYIPKFKLINSKVFNWTWENTRETGRWEESRAVGKEDKPATFQEIYKDIYMLDDPDRQIYEDDRPPSITIPSPQTFSISAFYKGQPQTIRGLLTYSLNNSYDPKAQQKGIQSCRDLNDMMNSPSWKILSFLPWIIILGFLALITYISYTILRRWRRINKKI